MARGVDNLEQDRLLERKGIFEGKVVRLFLDRVMLPNGREAEREVVRHWGAVGIVPLDEEGGLVLVEQYRHATGESLLEIPAGKLLPGEDPMECAVRELKEEVGISASSWTRLCSFYTSPGFSDEMLHLFLAEGLTSGEAEPDEDEFLEIRRIGVEEAYGMVLEGGIKDSKTVAGVLMALLRWKGLYRDKREG
jgi:ADP-ribose pyrophosphatase